jgi:hypothetical protein
MTSLNSLRRFAVGATIAASVCSVIRAAEPESLDRRLEPYLKQFGLPHQPHSGEVGEKGAAILRRQLEIDRLGNPEKGSLPSKQEKVMVAESAPVGQHNPAERSFEGISAANASKLNGPAMRAAHRKHSGEGSIHY